MKLILNYNLFNEKLGIVDGLENLANNIVIGLENNKEFIYQGEYNNKNITIRCIVSPRIKADAALIVNNFKENKFTIKIKDKNSPKLKYFILHELKHLDRKMRTGKYDYETLLINFLKISDDYEFLFKKSGKDLLYVIIYYTSQEEFESYYTNIYYELKDMISETMTKEEKKKIIDDYLNRQEVFSVFKLLHNNEFDINILFKNKRSLNFFLSEIESLFKSFSHDGNIFGSYVSDFKKIKTLLKSLYWYLKNDDDEIKINKTANEINNMVNLSVRKNYKKFYRLYTLLI